MQRATLTFFLIPEYFSAFTDTIRHIVIHYKGIEGLLDNRLFNIEAIETSIEVVTHVDREKSQQAAEIQANESFKQRRGSINGIIDEIRPRLFVTKVYKNLGLSQLLSSNESYCKHFPCVGNFVFLLVNICHIVISFFTHFWQRYVNPLLLHINP